MLQRNEIGTQAHILSWLASKDEDERFEWMSGDCPAGQYASAFELPDTGAGIDQLNHLAHFWPHNFGALYDRVCRNWR